MIKIIKETIFLLLFIVTIGYAKTPNDSVVINRVLISNTAKKIIFDVYAPGKDVHIFTNKDKKIFYYVYFGIINPTKKKYQIEIICVDKKDNIVFQEATERTLIKYPDYIGEDIVKNQEQMLWLDPTPGAIVKGQRLPLKSDNDYFIELYIEKKLVGVSRFTYQVMRDAKQDGLEKEKKIEAAQKMLEEGSEPDFVSKLTGISLENIKLLQRLDN
ncbi:hypothetical protein [Legionella maioricensis]|uniref:Uncharacterized protein n=1 Tax=Legionella maioricensis TaxID=2896528 RepID=A0A9X2D3W4_9GAMM|nr:hypothetical protein [Legionella maioricensis]MCL9685787.1 hypothetical protein [Legionella maioricensis]MCL9689204.1 hypothetical protein [Legionella maioricensis]